MSGTNPRGVVVAEVGGHTRRLRLSLGAIAEIEVLTNEPFTAVAVRLNDEKTIRFGEALMIFGELCRAGGTPLSEEEREDLLLGDLSDMIAAITQAFQASGALDPPDAPRKKSPGKKTARPASRGRAGKS